MVGIRAVKSGKSGKEVETTLRQNVGKNFLAKTDLIREIRVSGAAREGKRTPE
jgi:hypothetical protein